MARRSLSIGQVCASLAVVLGMAAWASASPPALVSAVSRMTHGVAGTYDLPLPLSGGSGIECRSIAAGATIVLTFDQPISGGTATISAGKVSGTPSVAGNTLTISLSGLANAKTYKLSVSGVTNAASETGSGTLSFRTLKGDINRSGSVTAADVNQANVWVAGGYAVTNSTFVADVDLSGTLTKTDVNAIKAAVGTAVAGGATATAGSTSLNSNAAVTGSTTPSGTLYIATMSPQNGVTNSLGYGSATFLLSSDQTNGILRFSYSNLSTPKVSEHIHGPAAANQSAGILFDIDTPAPPSPTTQPLPDGSYQWVFGTVGTYTASQLVGFVQTGQTYINIHTSQWPSGEIRGQFTLANGSQTFTPPPPPPAITINPPTQYDAARFLQQAQFGGTYAEVQSLSNPNAANANTAINDWLTAQFNSAIPITPNYAAAASPTSTTFSPSSMYKRIYDRTTTVQAPNNYADALNFDRIPECWWQNAAGETDQLRQRIATAYSEIFVVSDYDGTVDGNIPGLATYYDMLADDAFVNFRQLLGDITLHPIMGQYLNMRGNNYSTTAGWAPNENYAREIMQLFTIGLYMLQPDGTLQLDQNGLPIPTYTQPTITQFAHVYTGWNTNGTAVVIPTFPQPTAPATQPVVVNFNSFYQKPMVITASKHSPFSKSLLNYPGAATYPAATHPAFIPANSSQTTTTATNELNFALDNIFNHPNVGPFICKALIQKLVTSNPSQGYVYRCAQVFNNDGTGVRGNMKAVITAIFTDYEARSPAILSNQFAGHMREPVIRMANVMRPFHAYSKSGKWKVGRTDTTLAQTILRSPTVFNFFSPDFAQPGPLQNSGLLSPEFDIIYETTITNSQNMLYTGIYSNGGGTGFKGDNYGTDVYLDHTNKGDNLLPYLSTYGLKATVAQIGLLINGAPLDSTTQSTVLNFIANNVSSSDYFGQVSAAIHLISTSPRGATQE